MKSIGKIISVIAMAFTEESIVIKNVISVKRIITHAKMELHVFQ